MIDKDAMVEVVLKAQRGDERAFNTLVKNYEKLVYFIAMQYTHNSEDAKDIMQDTFIEVQRSIKNLKEPKFFKAWLNKITFSKTTRLFAKRRDVNFDIDSEQNLYRLSEERNYMIPEKDMKFQNERDLLQYCLDQLKPMQRQVLMMFYFEELKMSEIAYILDIPEGTVKSRISFAKKELKKVVEEVQEIHNFSFDFRIGSLESALVVCFMNTYTKLSLPLLPTSLPFKSLKSNIMANPLLSIVVSASIATAGVGAAYQTYQHMQSQNANHKANQSIQKEEDTFPPITYNNYSIDTARKAYTVLYEEVYLNKDSAHQIDIDDMQKVYETLKEFGGTYYTMAQHLQIESLL